MIEITVSLNILATEIKDRGSVPAWGTPSFTPAGIELIESLMEHLKEKSGALIGRIICNHAILTIGTRAENMTMIMRGRNLSDGMPLAVEVTREEILTAMAGVLDEIVQRVARQLKPRFRELTLSDLVGGVIWLDGDFKHLHGLDQRLAEAIGIPVRVVEGNGL